MPASGSNAYTKKFDEPTNTVPVGPIAGELSTMSLTPYDHFNTPVTPSTAYTVWSWEPKYTYPVVVLTAGDEYTLFSVE